MTDRPLSQTELAHTVADQLGISHAAGQAAVRAVLDTITRTVTSGRDVSLTNFGTFRAVISPARKARNPQTGGTIQVAARRAVRFRVAPRLHEVVAGGNPTASIRKRTSR